MALTKGITRTKVELDEFPEVPDSIPRDRWDRPLITPPDGGKPTAYTRASTLGKAIEDTYHLSKWQQRSVAFGLSRRPDLVALVSSIRTNEDEDRGPLDELCEKAHEAAKGDKGANIGTALHRLSERRDVDDDLSYLTPDLLAAMDAYAEQMRPFKVLASETFVVCDPLCTAGSFDRVVELLVDLEFHHATKGRIVLPAGTVLVLDLKTGKISSGKYWGATYGVQQTVYACGEPYDLGIGRKSWEELLGEGLRPSTDWALILHVPSDSPQDAGLVVVDLEAGAIMADLCLEIRQARKNKGLMSEAYPVVPPISVSDPPDDEGAGELLVLIARAAHEAELEALWVDYRALWTKQHTEATKTRLAELTRPLLAPDRVRLAGLMGDIRRAPNEVALTALWEANRGLWNEDTTRMAKARIKEFSAAVRS
jgi:hypothetical protein